MFSKFQNQKINTNLYYSCIKLYKNLIIKRFILSSEHFLLSYVHVTIFQFRRLKFNEVNFNNQKLILKFKINFIKINFINFIKTDFLFYYINYNLSMLSMLLYE